MNIARASGAVGILIGDDLYEKNGDALAGARSREAGLPTKLWPFSEAFALPDLAVESERGGRRCCAGRAPTRWRR